jgi:hypothetical protein
LSRGEVDDFARRVFAIDEGALEREVDEADHDLVLPDRNLAEHQRHPRSGLQKRQRLAHALVRLVDLVDEEKARNTALLQLAQHQLQLRHLALVGLAHHHGGVDRRQHRAHLLHEFDGAWTIEKRISVAEEIGGGDGELDAHLVRTRLRVGVAHRVSGLDRARPVYRAGARQNRFE